MTRFSQIVDKLIAEKTFKGASKSDVGKFLDNTLDIIRKDIQSSGCSLDYGEPEVRSNGKHLLTFLTINLPKEIRDEPICCTLMLEKHANGYILIISGVRFREAAKSPEEAADMFFDTLSDIT